jgi:pimeloyl-ACP methyl ester carboxylesterase
VVSRLGLEEEAAAAARTGTRDLDPHRYRAVGERVHVASPHVDLETHIADMLGVLPFEDLRDVVRIGHSDGGMVATGVADRAPERVAPLVYLDAFVPRDGPCLFDLLGAESRARMREAAHTVGHGWRTPPSPVPADTCEEDVAWVTPRRVMQPLRTFEQPVQLTGAGERRAKASMYCTRPRSGDVFLPFAQRARTETGWRSFEIDASHNVHITAPEALATLLDHIAATPPAA